VEEALGGDRSSGRHVQEAKSKDRPVPAWSYGLGMN
jgi:hypothetical protein